MAKRSPTEQKLIEVLGAREWTTWREIEAEMPPRTQWRRILQKLHKAGEVEERAETLTQNRKPGWVMDLLLERGFTQENIWSQEAWDFAQAVRLVSAAPFKKHLGYRQRFIEERGVDPFKPIQRSE